MATMNRLAAAEFELERYQAKPAREALRNGGAQEQGAAGSRTAAVVAAALFGAGVLSVIFFGRPAAVPAPAKVEPVQPPASADTQVLVPFGSQPAMAPQYEDGLVAFSGAAPIVDERPAAVAQVPQQPSFFVQIRRAARAAALAAPLVLASQRVGAHGVINFRGETDALAPGGASPKIDPLVLDLGGDGMYTGTRATRYDLDGNGRLGYLRDIAASAGVLVFDAHGDGLAGSSGLELFGNRTDLDANGKSDGYADGFDALRAFVDRAQARGILAAGTLERGRLSAADLAALRKAYGLGIRVGGLGARTISLEEAGVRELVLSEGPTHTVSSDFDGRGNGIGRREGAYFVRADGSTGSYADVFMAYNAARLRTLSWAR